MNTLKINSLLSNSFFEGVSRKQIELLDSEQFIPKRYKKGDEIITQDTCGHEMYLIVSGIVRIYRINKTKDVDLAIRSAGEYVGEMALFDGNLRSATVSAMTDVDVYTIKTQAFLMLLNQFDSIKNNLIKTITHAIRESGHKFCNETVSHKELLSYKELELVRVKDLLDQTIELKRGIDEQKDELELINRELERKNRELNKLTLTDELTNLYTRDQVYKLVDTEYSRSKRYGIPFSVLLIGIDNLKSLSDNYGHIAGDDILKHTVDTIEQIVRKEDILGRVGGEAFALILPHMKIDNAYTVASKVKSIIECGFYTLNGENIKITVSVGIADSTSENISESKDILHQADIALSLATKQGVNSVEVYTEGLSMETVGN